MSQEKTQPPEREPPNAQEPQGAPAGAVLAAASGARSLPGCSRIGNRRARGRARSRGKPGGGSGNGTSPSSKGLAGAAAPGPAFSRGEQRAGRTEVTRGQGQGGSAGHSGGTRQPPGWAQRWPPARLAPAGAPHITRGARPTHPLTHAAGGGAGPPGGGAGSAACGCCNAPPDPSAAGQDAGSALTPLSLTLQPPPPPRRAHRSSPTAGRADTHMAGPDRTGQNRTVPSTEIQNRPPAR